MALTDILWMSYEPPRRGLPPARERRVACGEAGDAPSGAAEQHKNAVFVRRTATEFPKYNYTSCSYFLFN